MMMNLGDQQNDAGSAGLEGGLSRTRPLSIMTPADEVWSEMFNKRLVNAFYQIADRTKKGTINTLNQRPKMKSN